MKRILLFLFLCSFCSAVHSQQLKQYSYLIIRLQAKHDDAGERYYRVLPEEGNPNSSDINALVKYSTKLKNERAAFLYSSKSDSVQAVFNYFPSISSALEYLDARGWRLLTVVNDVSGNNGATSTETSYYLRKEL